MDADARVSSRYEITDDLGSNGSEMEVDRDGYAGEALDKKLRDSRKHRRSKDRKDGSGNKDRERSKERERDNSSRRHLDRQDTRERDRDRERRKGDADKEHDRDRNRDKERSRDKAREKEKDEGHSERVRGRDREKDRDYEQRGKDREKGSERLRDKDRDKGRDREKDHEKHREKVKDRDRERGKDREREREKGRERETEREDDGEAERGRDKEKYDKSRTRDKDRDASWKKGGEEYERMEVDGGDAKIVRNDGEEADAHASNQEKPLGSQSTSKLEERLIKMKQEKLKRKADDASEILSWVSKSRKLEDKRNVEREKATRISRILDEQDNVAEESDDETAAGHGGKDLAGVKILHGLNKVIEGGAVVLTLKDQNILADGDINEEVDVLENVEIGEQRRRDDAYKAAKKNTALYEDKFNDGIGAQKTMLPQYDDPVEDEGVTLDESGRFTGEAEKKLAELRKRIEGGSTSRAFEDLNSTAKNISDYYTADEMLQFQKPKKKKSLRKREKLDLDAMEAEAKSVGLGLGDLGSRRDNKALSAKEEMAKTDAEMRSNAYQTALAKAEEASKVLRQEQTWIAKAADDDDMVFGEDYEDLEKSLAQTRKLALKKEEDVPSVPQAVALLATANKEQEDNQSSTVGEPQENKVVITEMEEFVLGLQLNEETHKPESEDVFKDEDHIPKPVEYEMEEAVDGGWTEINEANMDEEPVNKVKEDITTDGIIHEVAVGKGLSGALKLLKDRGTLKESIDWGGRNMDKKKSKLVGINDNDGPKEIRIERTDEFGRVMTPKEAFRMISHKFHGKGPGKMKQEKRMKQYQEDLKSKQMKGSDTPLHAMERMREAQVQLQSPYIVLSGHVKPGQTSDPRSGFATLEKDRPGSLTPMLGDKKVEHFLGINRRPDSSSMGPPPPKKPKS